jgi:hypothetical protein
LRFTLLSPWTTMQNRLSCRGHLIDGWGGIAPCSHHSGARRLLPNQVCHYGEEAGLV